MMGMPKVSVVIPVYGVERYIERCCRSLFEQTLDDIEYVFVDDGTPDRSIEILEKTLDEYHHRVYEAKSTTFGNTVAITELSSGARAGGVFV